MLAETEQHPYHGPPSADQMENPNAEFAPTPETIAAREAAEPAKVFADAWQTEPSDATLQSVVALADAMLAGPGGMSPTTLRELLGMAFVAGECAGMLAAVRRLDSAVKL